MPHERKQGKLFLVPIRGDDKEYRKIMDTLSPRERALILLGTAAHLVTVPVIGTLESDKKPPAQ